MRFPNARPFDVADFDAFRHRVCAFVSKMLHPQRGDKYPPSCEKSDSLNGVR